MAIRIEYMPAQPVPGGLRRINPFEPGTYDVFPVEKYIFQSGIWRPTDFAMMSAFKSYGLNGEEIIAGGLGTGLV